ncbi:MAG TPA: hypothetical protein PKW07_10690 [Syntrophorhabdaceae bacterium]|nr:hypothetical protein [Syntrophorhabdaceae bacterium]
MKRIGIISLAMLLVIFVASAAMAQGFGFGKKKEDTAKVDVDGLSKQALSLITKVQLANITFGEGIVSIQEAVGKKEEAERLRQLIANAKEKKGDKNVTKELVAEVNNATASLSNVELGTQINKEQAQKFLWTSVTNIGIGVILDGLAAKDASDLLKEAQGALKQVSFTSAGKVKDVIDVSQFIVKEIPPQASSLQKYSSKLIDYMKTNGIPTPSPESIKKAANEKLKEG